MAKLLLENFEAPGYENSWAETIGVGNTITDAYDAVTPPIGTYGLRSVLGGTNIEAYTEFNMGAQQSTCYNTVFFRLSSASVSTDTAQMTIFAMDGFVNNARVQLRYTASRGWHLFFQYYNSGVQPLPGMQGDVNDNLQISTDTWYRFGLYYSSDANEITGILWSADGTTVIDQATATLTNARVDSELVQIGAIDTRTAAIDMAYDFAQADDAVWPTPSLPLTTQYCDLTISADGTGTELDPYQESQIYDSGVVLAGNTVNIRGSSTALTRTVNVASSANGTSGNPVTYQQWSGETQANFNGIFIVTGTGDAFYDFIGLAFDAGTGTTALRTFNLEHTGAGDVNFSGCSIYGFRSTSFATGDFYPYYIGDVEVAYENIYSMSIRYCIGITLVIDGCEFLHGWRPVRVNGLGASDITVSNCSFDRVGEDALNFFGSSNVLVTQNSFGETAPASALYAGWFWPGAATGSWVGQEGALITQDNTSASGMFVGIDSLTRFWIVVDDLANLPVRTNTNIWRLDSDPTNIYWTPSGSGENAHNDLFSMEGTCDNVIVEKNYFYSTVEAATGATNYGQAVKFGAAGITNAFLINNIIDKWDVGAYSILIDNVGDIVIANNTIIAISNPSHGIRTVLGTSITVSNNILSGGVHSGGTVVSDYNIYVDAAGPWGAEANSLFSQDFSNSPAGNLRYFTNYTTGVFSPYNGSAPNIDIGSAAYAPADDYLGTARPQDSVDDIGAYEWAGAAPTPPSGTNKKVAVLVLQRLLHTKSIRGEE